MATVDMLGQVTKWMSDPPTKRPAKAFIDDNKLETLRVEDRVETFAYNPNLNILKDQNCVAINFGWTSELSFPSLRMSLKSQKSLNQEAIRFSVPSGCMIVFVGGKLMHRLDDIIKKVDHFSWQLSIKTLAYF